MNQVLVVEDDIDLNQVISRYLKSLGYNVISAKNGLDALNYFYANKIDIVLTDVMMPLCDGFELASTIREKDAVTPVIFMSARDDKPTKQKGYKLGIDDYITKPFDLDELGFKIKAILRRLSIDQKKEINIGNFKMNEEEHIATIDEKEINLSVREFDILFHLLSNPKKIFTRSALMEQFWDYDSSTTSRTVDVHLSKLREKTKECNGFEIETVHGLGYKVVLK